VIASAAANEVMGAAAGLLVIMIGAATYLLKLGIERVHTAVRSVDHAVNNVGPDEPTLREKVDALVAHQASFGLQLADVTAKQDRQGEKLEELGVLARSTDERTRQNGLDFAKHISFHMGAESTKGTR
jgi:hypothetical protein